MSVRIARLKSGEDVIADIQEICHKDQPDKPVAYLFGKPYIIDCRENKDLQVLTEEPQKIDDISVIFYPWAPMSSEEKLMCPIEWVVTIYKPYDIIFNKYQTLTKGGEEENVESVTPEVLT